MAEEPDDVNSSDVWAGSILIRETMSYVPFSGMGLNNSVVSYAPSPPAAITNWSFSTVSNLVVSAQAYPNLEWVIQGSTNLFNWSDLETNTADQSGQLLFQLPIDASVPQKFFRIRAP